MAWGEPAFGSADTSKNHKLLYYWLPVCLHCWVWCPHLPLDNPLEQWFPDLVLKAHFPCFQTPDTMDGGLKGFRSIWCLQRSFESGVLEQRLSWSQHAGQGYLRNRFGSQCSRRPVYMSIKYSNTMVIKAGIDTCGCLGRSKVLQGNENIPIKLVSKAKLFLK